MALGNAIALGFTSSASPPATEYLKDIDGNNILDIDGNPTPVIT